MRRALSKPIPPPALIGHITAALQGVLQGKSRRLQTTFTQAPTWVKAKRASIGTSGKGKPWPSWALSCTRQQPSISGQTTLPRKRWSCGRPPSARAAARTREGGASGAGRPPAHPHAGQHRVGVHDVVAHRVKGQAGRDPGITAQEMADGRIVGNQEAPEQPMQRAAVGLHGDRFGPGAGPDRRARRPAPNRRDGCGRSSPDRTPPQGGHSPKHPIHPALQSATPEWLLLQSHTNRQRTAMDYRLSTAKQPWPAAFRAAQAAAAFAAGRPVSRAL